jgi:hypothetical protein
MITDKKKVAALVEKYRNVVLSNPDWVNKLESGQPLSRADMAEIPDEVASDVIRDIPKTDKGKTDKTEMNILLNKYPSARIGVK